MKQKGLDHIDHSGFKTPENYFEGLEDRIYSQAKLKDQISDSGFKTPENYFDTLESRLLPQIESNKETKVLSLWNKKTIVYISSIAAALLILLYFNPSGTKDTFGGLDNATVDSFILDEIDSSDLAALFTDSDLSEAEFIDYQLNDDTIDLYLEDLDDNDLIIE